MQYYKTTKRNGMSFHGNVKYEVGKTVRKGKCDNPKLCSADVLHASPTALEALYYANTLDCNLYVVAGEPVVSDKSKSGFFSLEVLREIPDSEKDAVLGFRYNEAMHPVDPCSIESDLSDMDIANLHKWGSVWDSVRDSVASYVGSLFPGIEKWLDVNHAKGDYPYQVEVDLWKRGFILVTSVGKLRLYHPVRGKPAKLVYQED